MSKLRWFPTSHAARIYLMTVYGVLAPWFIICFVWGGILKAEPVSPVSLRLQLIDLLNLLALPPLTGIAIDLLIAKWADERYKPTVRKIGRIVLLAALFFMLIVVLRFYVFRS